MLPLFLKRFKYKILLHFYKYLFTIIDALSFEKTLLVPQCFYLIHVHTNISVNCVQLGGRNTTKGLMCLLCILTWVHGVKVAMSAL